MAARRMGTNNFLGLKRNFTHDLRFLKLTGENKKDLVTMGVRIQLESVNVKIILYAIPRWNEIPNRPRVRREHSRNVEGLMWLARLVVLRMNRIDYLDSSLVNSTLHLRLFKTTQHGESEITRFLHQFTHVDATTGRGTGLTLMSNARVCSFCLEVYIEDFVLTWGVYDRTPMCLPINVFVLYWCFR